MDFKKIFVITPIGKQDSEEHKKYKAIFETMIKPGVEMVDPEFQIIKADEIAKPGSFIKDILANLYSSYIVIANLTGLNPNVFYELGIRHTLSNRTIMITEDINSLPSDLKEYRVIEYKADITGVEIFKQSLSKSIIECLENPDYPDNPVHDRLDGYIKRREEDYINEIQILQNRIKNLEQGKTIKKQNANCEESEIISKRVSRILKIMLADEQNRALGEPAWRTGANTEDEKRFSVSLPLSEFKFYFVLNEDKHIACCLIIAIHNDSFNLDGDLADIRVMVKEYNQENSMNFKFIIATSLNLSEKKEYINKWFNKVLREENIKKSTNKFSLEIWDEEGLVAKEIKLCLRMQPAS